MPSRALGLQPQESKEPSLDGMTVVVTGAAGEVGSVVTEELLAAAAGCARSKRAFAEDQGCRAGVVRRRRGVAPGRDRGALDLAHVRGRATV